MNEGKILQLVTFRLEGEEFGVDILKVQEINKMIDITRIPNAPSFCRRRHKSERQDNSHSGPRKRLGFDGRAYDKSTRIIVVELEGMMLGFIVDSVSEVLRISESTVEPPPALVAGIESEYIEGVGKLDNRLLILVGAEEGVHFYRQTGVGKGVGN